MLRSKSSDPDGTYDHFPSRGHGDRQDDESSEKRESEQDTVFLKVGQREQPDRCSRHDLNQRHRCEQ